jgi:hypothetical protein
MKITGLLLLTIVPAIFAASIEIETQETKESPVPAESQNAEAARTKRAGFSLFGTALQNLPKAAFSASSTAVAGGSSSLSGGSSGSHGSGGEYHGHTYVDTEHDPHHDDKSFDGWSLKKSILNTVLQAVKAIAGGVTTLKGQLIKGSGYLVTNKGKLITQAGDSVSNAGKSIVKSAHLISPDHDGGHNSIGFSLGSKFGGLTNSFTKTISGLSSGSAGSITQLSSGSSGKASGSSSGGSSSSGYGYDDHHSSVVDSHSTLFNFNPKPDTFVSHTSFPGPSPSYGAPSSSYGAPEYHDHQYQGTKIVVT